MPGESPAAMLRATLVPLLGRTVDSGIDLHSEAGRERYSPRKGGCTDTPEARTPVEEIGKAPQSSGSDLAMTDLHIKAKKFLEKTGTTLDELNQVLYKEGDALLPLYEDLKTTKVSESQVRIGLLLALANGIRIGEFEFDGEAVRRECQTRKCYDPGNFAVNFKNNASLFDGFEEIAKNGIRNTAETISTTWFQEIAPALAQHHVLSTDTVETYSGHFATLLKLSHPNNLRSRYLDVLKAILEQFHDDVILPIQTEPKLAKEVSLLEKVLDGLPSVEESSYLKEAASCAAQKFFRAAAVLGWYGSDRSGPSSH